MRRLVVGVVLGALLALPAGAAASAYTRVEHAYEQAGTITPCRFSSRELQAALKQAPTYTLEYFGDFVEAVDAALAEQGGGQCSSGHGLAAIREYGLQGVQPPTPPASVTAGTGGGIPLPFLLALILVAGLGLTGGAAILIWASGADPRWLHASRHSWAEAEYRFSGTWAEFRDWLRQ